MYCFESKDRLLLKRQVRVSNHRAYPFVYDDSHPERALYRGGVWNFAKSLSICDDSKPRFARYFAHGLYRGGAQNFSTSHGLEKELEISPSPRAFLQVRARNFSKPYSLCKEDNLKFPEPFTNQSLQTCGTHSLMRVSLDSRAFVKAGARNFSRSQSLCKWDYLKF